MESILKTIFPCLPFDPVERGIQLPADDQSTFEKAHHPFSTLNEKEVKLSSDEAASSIVSAILDADKIDHSLDATIESLVHQAGGWHPYLAKKILAALESVLKAKKYMGTVLQPAIDKACEAAEVFEGFAKEHPFVVAAFCTVIALGVLVVVAPYALEWLGFSELGPIEGSWAAQWQSTYQGFVPKGSLFSYFQRLGMTWKRVIVVPAL